MWRMTMLVCAQRLEERPLVLLDQTNEIFPL